LLAPQGGSEAVEIAGGLGQGEGILLLGSREGEVIVLAREDGAQLWRSPVSSEILSPPVSDGRVVVVLVNDGRIFALDGSSGKRLWVYESSVPALSLRGTSTPLLDSRKAIVGLANGKLVALSLQKGKVIWEATVAVPEGRSELERIVDIDGDPLLRDGVVYAAAYHGRVVAVSVATGRILWSRDLSTYHTMALDKDHLYVSDEEGVLWALDPRSGAVLWKQDELQGRNLTAPALDGTLLVVGDNTGYLHWLSPEDGALLARYHVSEVGLPGPLVTRDGRLYLKDLHNAVYVLETEKVRRE
ncbi:MAG: outer membrane protein assembly factor BamB, partial [Gammaproteobacteria bacterium]